MFWNLRSILCENAALRKLLILENECVMVDNTFQTLCNHILINFV